MLRETMVEVQVDLAGGHHYPPRSTTRVESGMEEHKIISSRGSSKYEYGG